MTERGAFGLALLGHLLLLAALSVGLARAWQLAPDQPDVTPVEFVELGAVTSVREEMALAPEREAAPRVDPDMMAEVAPRPEPARPEPEVAEPSIAELVADTTAQDAIAAEVAAPPPPPKEQPKPAPTRRFDAGAMAALIDKALPEGERQPKAEAAREKAGATAPVSPVQMATLQQAIRAQIAPCWNPPVGGADVAKMTAVLAIRLNRDGSVAGPLELVSQTGVSEGNRAYARAFVEAARRAVLRCAPLKLPVELYPYWGAFELNFDPSMLT